MAVIHRATISPTKQELLDAEFGGPVEILGSYRFDDPDGEVGVEGFVLDSTRGRAHVVLTYRGAPIDGARLLTTMDHSALGPRWVYDGATDPVAVGCLRRALVGEQEQAALEVWSDGVLVDTREPTITLSVHGSIWDPTAGTAVEVRRELEPGQHGGEPELVATWAGGSAAIARLVS